MRAGEPATFRNDGGAEHTVTSDELGIDLAIAAGASVTRVFERAGTYGYVCKYHPPDMRGTLVVEAAA